MILLIVITVITVLFLLVRNYRYNYKLPPGPIGLPILGCIPYVNSRTAHLTVENWCRKYGSLLSFYMGDTLVVVLGDCEIIREAFLKNDIFNGRNVIRAFRATGYRRGMGLAGSEGELWQEQRRFCLRNLKDFGAGRSILEPKIKYEALFLCEEFSKQQGRPFDLRSYLHYAVANVIMQFVFGFRFDYEDTRYIDWLSKITYRLSESGVNGFSAFNFLPILLKLPGQCASAKKVIAEGDQLLQFLRPYLDEKRRQFQESRLSHDSQMAEDYVSAFLKAQEDGEGNYFSDEQLLMAVQQLFIAGSETTSTTLRWILWHLCKHQDVQEKIYEEMKQITGDDTEHTLNWADRQKLPYLEATVCEVERIISVFPFSVTHRALENTTLRGYRIPKNAYVIPLTWAIHRDPNYFPQPDEFRPERFLDENGKLTKNGSFLPFGIGARSCLGESLAKMELYIFLTTLLQKFHFRFAISDVNSTSYEEAVVGTVISPAPFKVIVEERAQVLL